MDAMTFDQMFSGVLGAADAAPREMTTLVMFDDGDDFLVTGLTANETDQAQNLLNSLPLAGRSLVAMASRVMWTPEPEPAPTVDSWAVVTVAEAATAGFAVRRLDIDERWWRLEPPDAPWFMLSTAAALRRALAGESMVVKDVQHRALFNAPGQGPVPSVDEHGLL